MTVGKGQTQRKLGETPASLLWDLPFLLLLLFICQGLRQGSHPQQGRECMTKKSRVGKCQRRSGCGRAEAELPIPASDIYIGRDATKAKTATAAEALAKRAMDRGQHPCCASPEHHK